MGIDEPLMREVLTADVVWTCSEDEGNNYEMNTTVLPKERKTKEDMKGRNKSISARNLKNGNWKEWRIAIGQRRKMF